MNIVYFCISENEFMFEIDNAILQYSHSCESVNNLFTDLYQGLQA